MKIKFNGLILIIMSVVLYAAASNTQSGWQYIITAVLLSLLLIGIVLPRKTLINIDIKKYIPSSMQVGKDTIIEIELNNLSKAPKRYLSIEDIPLAEHKSFLGFRSPLDFLPLSLMDITLLFSDKTYAVNYFMCVLPSMDTISFKYFFVPSKRGVFVTGNLNVSTSFPLGLFLSVKEYNPLREIVVYPKVLEIRGGWVNRIANKSTVSELSYTYVPTSMTATTRSLREYVPGDSPRHIHWPTSARLNRLFVREFEIEASGFVYIVLDASVGYETEELFELAVISVASLLNACHEKGLVTRFVTQEEAYSGVRDFKNDNWDSQLEVLARVKPLENSDICRVIDALHQTNIVQNLRAKPMYILVSHSYKADQSANRANIISICVSSRADLSANYTITSELDLRYI